MSAANWGIFGGGGLEMSTKKRTEHASKKSRPSKRSELYIFRGSGLAPRIFFIFPPFSKGGGGKESEGRGEFL